MICMGTNREIRSVKANVNSKPIQFMGTSLEFQEIVRILGMVLDERLTWTVHTNDIVKRVNFRLKHLSTFRYVLNEHVMVMWCTTTRVVATKKSFRGHTITVSVANVRRREHISMVSGRDCVI
jgi:hypothetical protein